MQSDAAGEVGYFQQSLVHGSALFLSVFFTFMYITEVKGTTNCFSAILGYGAMQELEVIRG